jgi:hypothetical protein
MVLERWRLGAATVFCAALSVCLVACEDEHAPYFVETPDELDGGEYEEEGEEDAEEALDAAAEMDSSLAARHDAGRDADARDARADATQTRDTGAADTGHGHPGDAQQPTLEAGSPAPPDGGAPPPEAGMPPPDGGLPRPPDAGPLPPPEGGMPPHGGHDAGAPPPDAGPTLDAGQPAQDASAPDAGDAAAALDASYDAGIGQASAVDGGACTLTANTYASAVTNAAGCRLLVRDASACAAARVAQGLSGFWLKFSCRVTLNVTTNGASQVVIASADNLPDYKSNYFTAGDACYEVYNGAIRNPNNIAEMALTLQFPRSPTLSHTPFSGAIVGLALNGVGIFGNFAAPTDDIYMEAQTFDRCGAHPQMHGMYHYHSEPYSISNDDANFIGVLRDGYPVYGRREMDGSYPSNLDNYGGHTASTPDSPTPVYHYHLSEQTQTDMTKSTYGQKQWFLTKGAYRGAPGACMGCN